MLGSTDTELTADWLAARGVQYLVVGPERLEGERSFDPFRRETDDLVVLPARRLDPAGGALAVHRLLAESALGVVDRASREEDRTTRAVDQQPTVLLLDASDGSGRSQLRTLLEALARPSGPVQARTVAESGSLLDRRALPDKRMSPPDTVDLQGVESDLGAIAGDIDSFGGTVGTDDPRTAQWRRMLLVAGAGTAKERAGLAAAVRSEVQAAIGLVELPSTDLITVTSHRADLPIAVRNTTTHRLKLAMALDSSDLLIDTPNQLIELGPGETVDISVPVRLDRAGEFSLNVRLTSADGRFALAEQELRVRSTSVPGAGIAVSAGALLFSRCGGFGTYGASGGNRSSSRSPTSQHGERRLGGTAGTVRAAHWPGRAGAASSHACRSG